jgi:hypothetical protein
MVIELDDLSKKRWLHVSRICHKMDDTMPYKRCLWRKMSASSYFILTGRTQEIQNQIDAGTLSRNIIL